MTLRCWTRVVCGVAAALLVAVGSAVPAYAATASMRVDSGEDCDEGGCGGAQVDQISFLADPGESNDLLVTVSRTTVLYEDRGAAVAAGAGCAAVGVHRVSCPIAPNAMPYDFWVAVSGELGDGNDRGRVTRVASRDAVVTMAGDSGDDILAAGDGVSRAAEWAGRARLDGGDGNDRISGSSFADDVLGGPGADTLRGRGGDDVLEGDPAAGPFVPGAPATAPGLDAIAPDVIDGGPGTDRVEYRSGPVAVDLADPRPDGRPGESDVLISIEGVFVAGDARLRGDANPNVLWTDQPGASTLLDGGAGDDVLIGGTRAVGGSGDDLFLRSRVDAIRCGTGIDSFEVPYTVSLPRIPVGCERAYLPNWVDVPLEPPHARNGTLSVRIYPIAPGSRFNYASDFNTATTDQSWEIGVTVTITDPARHRLLARGALRVRKPTRKLGVLVHAQLTAAGWQRLRAGLLAVRVTVLLDMGQRLTFPTRIVR